MADHQPDSRTLNFAGDVDDQGYSLPMTIDVLRRRTEKWPGLAAHAGAFAGQLARSSTDSLPSEALSARRPTAILPVRWD